MHGGTKTSSTQTLPGTVEPDDPQPRPGTDYLRCLVECGRVGAHEAAAAEVAGAVARLVVEHCADIRLVAVHRVDDEGRHAVLLAIAGPSMATSTIAPRLLLSTPFRWPADEAGAAAAAMVVALEEASTGRVLGWLRVEADGPASVARSLFAQAVAQGLAIALVRAAERESVRAAAQAARQREQRVSAFLGAISHEFRTPLTLLIGPLESHVERSADAGLKVALRHAQRLKRLVDTLLDFSNIDAGRIDPVLRPVDIAAMTRDVASLFQGAAVAAGIALAIDCPPLPQPVRVDRAQWEQVLIHLLGNAIRLTEAGEVRVTLRAHPGLMTLEVTDTGRGISQEDLPHVFDRFQPARDDDDSGLGLALVHNFVRLHGGDIEVSSVPGRGSRFRVCIPMLGGLSRVVSHRHIDRHPAGASRLRAADALGWPVADTPRAAGDAVAPVATTRERIVLVVDHRELREYLAGLLRPHYRVQSLGEAGQALQAVQERAPDLLLVDLDGAAGDVLEFMRHLRASTAGATVPALLLSADTREFLHTDALEAGADDVLVKPFVAAELLARVGAHMRLSRDRRALHRRLAAHNRDLETQVAERTAALAVSEARFKAISNLVPDILWRSDAQGQPEWRSEQWRRYTGDGGVSAGMEYVHPDDRAATQAWVQDTVSRRVRTPHEYRLRRHDGAYRWFIARMSALTDGDGRIEHWFGSATDIERQRVARHALEAEVDERTVALAEAAGIRQELLHRLSRSQEDERRRIARELHDSLGQYLTALKLALSALAPAIGDPQLRERVHHLDALTTKVDLELDHVIAALRPVVLDELGLAGALPGIVADWSRQSGIAAEALLVHLGDERFDEDIESTLYRVTQESLTNIAKHASARSVAVTLARRQDELHLSVEDDGVGFDAAPPNEGWGLRGMAERMRLVGGVLQIESTPGSGTAVLARVACRPRALQSSTRG